MLPSPSFVDPARTKRLHRIAVPVALTCSLVAGGLVAVIGAAGSASAAAATGTFAIGDTPVALNQASDPELGVITPTADAAENGMYGSVASWPIIPLHAAVARNGQLITFGTPINTVAQSGVVFDTWDTTKGLTIAAHVDSDALHGYDSFCNAAVSLADGRLLMVSGQWYGDHRADMMSMVYDPSTGAQDMGADLAYKRWYVTALRLTDNRILLLGGGDAGNTGAYATPDVNTGVASVPEIGTGTGAWTDLAGATSTALFGATDNHWWYPRAFNGPNGTVVGFSGDQIWSLDVSGNGSVTKTGTLPFNPKVSGSQVMYAPGKILIAGGGQVNNDDPTAGTNQAAILDVSGATPTTTMTNAMRFGRNWLNLTVLPTGEVLANGGTLIGTNAGDANSVKQAEIWNPTTGTWRTAATAQRTRTYHSTSLLLPSGAVFTGGSGNPGPEDNFNAELYYPSYLFTKAADGSVQWASRPAISAIAGSATYGGSVALTIGDGRAISSASLISLPTVTHSQNTDQRRIPLDITQKGGTVTATLPGSVNTMPPGDYELTVVDANGVPSAAQIITVRAGAAGLVTVAPEATATAAGTGAAAGTGVGATTGGGAATQPAKGTAAVKSVTLKKGSSIGLEAIARLGYRVSHSGSKVVMKQTGSTSTKKAKRITSWIVHTGLGSKKGYSFESVDRPGYYLAAPKKGAGGVTLVKRSTSASFKKRVTFSAVTGATGKGVTLRLTASPSLHLRTSGKSLAVRTIGETSADRYASTFAAKTGLAKK